MIGIAQYSLAREEIDSYFVGLPHVQRLLINILITRADPKTGLVENINYRDLSAFLTVDAAPGRKDSGAPTKQAIRNYLCTIVTQCGAYFQLSSEGQSLKVTFPTLPEIYKSHFNTSEVKTLPNTVSDTPVCLINTGEEAIFEGLVNTEDHMQVHTEVNTPEQLDAFNASTPTHAKIKPNNKTNKLTNTISNLFAELKQPIRHDFYPTQNTIEQALSKGFVKVTSDIEIKRFILYNQANATLWVDFNPVFLAWLERDHNPNNEQSTIKEYAHEQRATHKISGHKPTVADAIRRNQQIIDEERQRSTDDYIEGEYFESMVVSY